MNVFRAFFAKEMCEALRTHKLTVMGLVFLLLGIMNPLMAGELSRGTLTHLLTKGLSRKTVILSKFAASGLLWTASYLLCFAVTYAYTVYFWPDDAVQSLPASALGLWAFGVLMLSALLFGGVLFKNNYGCLLFVGALVAALYLANIAPFLKAYDPVMLSSNNMELLSGQRAATDFAAPAMVSLALTTAFLSGSILVFNRRAL